MITATGTKTSLVRHAARLIVVGALWLLWAALIITWAASYIRFDEFVINFNRIGKPVANTGQLILNNRWGRLWVQCCPDYPLGSGGPNGHTGSLQLDSFDIRSWLHRESPLPWFRFQKVVQPYNPAYPNSAMQVFFDLDVPYWPLALVVGLPLMGPAVRSFRRRPRNDLGFPIDIRKRKLDVSNSDAEGQFEG